MKFRDCKNDMIQYLENSSTEPAVLGMVMNKIFRTFNGADVEKMREECEIKCEREMKNVIRYTQELMPTYAAEAAQKYAANKVMMDLIDLVLDED